MHAVGDWPAATFQIHTTPEFALLIGPAQLLQCRNAQGHGRTDCCLSLVLYRHAVYAGAFQQLAANPNHELGFLSLLFQLIQSSAVCSRLLADCSPSAARLQKGAAMRSGTGQQAQQMGGSAASLDATEPPLGDTVNVDMADAEGADRWACCIECCPCSQCVTSAAPVV